MWALYVLLGLLVLFILVLWVPVDAVFDWDLSKQPGARLRLAWLFGLVNFRLRRGQGQKKEPVREEKAKKKKRPSLGTVLRILRADGILRKVTGLISGYLRQVKVKELKADIRLGLDDPADFGLAFAAMSAVAPWLSLSPLRQVRIQPFLGEETSFQGTARAIISLQPVRLVIPSLRFVFSRPVLRAVKIVISDKMKHR